MGRVIDHDFPGLDHNFIRSTGPTPCRILFVGESGGVEEAKTGRAFAGQTGKELDKFYLPMAFLRRYEVRVTNLIPFHPFDNRDPTYAEIKYFEHLLVDEIIECQPEVIAPLGAFATRWFLGDADLHMVHGLPHYSKKAPGTIIMPCYHPAAGLHSTDNQALIAADFQRLPAALDGSIEPRPLDAFPEPFYLELTAKEEVWASLAENPPFVGLDTEGYKGSPWGLSYSGAAGTSFVIRSGSREAIRAFSQWIDEHPETVCILHNALHDLPILREMGINVVNFDDTMVYSYDLATEPQGLKPLSYRLNGMKMKSYEEVTGPAVRKMTTEYLVKVAQGDWGVDPDVPVLQSAKEVRYRTPQPLQKRALRAVNDILGMWEGTIAGSRRGGSAGLKELGVRVGKVNKEAAEGLSKHANVWDVKVPIPVMPLLEARYGEYLWDLKPPKAPKDPPDSRKRWSDMSKDLEESVSRCEEALGALPEVGLDAVEDQQEAVDYSARDADATLRDHQKIVPIVRATGMSELAALDMAVLPYLDRMKTTGIRVNRKHMLDYGEVLAEEMRDCQFRIEEKTGLWINPSSPPQTAHIVHEVLGFPVEKRSKKTGLPSTNDKILEALSPNDPTGTIEDITLYRELHKLRSTYAISLPKWTDENMRCHANWKYTRVASGRLSTSDPNLLAIPVKSARGSMIRAGFIPEPDHVFVQADLSQIEVRVTAHFSQDPSLIDIFLSGRDFHTATASYMWGISEEEIVADDEAKGGASMRASSKNVSFGILYGVTATGLRAQMRSKTGADWSEEKCQEMIDLWLTTAYPKVKGYMERQKLLCLQKGYVESMHGRRRYLPGARSTIPRVREEAFRAAINHPIQSTAAEILKLAERNIWRKVLPMFWGAGVFCEPVLQIHDELIFEVHKDYAEEMKACLVHEMETAFELCVPIIAKGKISRTGRDGGSWEEVK